MRATLIGLLMVVATGVNAIADAEHPPAGVGFMYHHGMQDKEAWPAIIHDTTLCMATVIFLERQNTSDDQVDYEKVGQGLAFEITTAVSSHYISKAKADAIRKKVLATASDELFANPALATKRLPHCLEVAPRN